MANKALIGLGTAVVVLAAAGGGYYYLKTSLEAQTAEALDGARKALPEGSTLTYGKISAEPLWQTVSIADVAFSVPSQKLEGQASVLRVSHRSGDAYDARVAGIKMKVDQQADVAIDAFSVDGAVIPGGDKGKELLSTLIDRNALGKEWVAEKIVASGITANVLVEPEKNLSVVATIGTVEEVGIADGIIRSTALRDFIIKLPDEPDAPKSISVAAVEIGNYNVARAKQRLLDSFGGSIPETPEAMAEAIEAGAKPDIGLDFDSAQIKGLGVEMKDGSKIEAAAAGLKDVKRDGAVVTGNTIFLDGLKVPFAQFTSTEIAPYLAKLKGDALVASFSSTYDLDPAQKTVHIGPTWVEVADLGRVDADIRFSGVDVLPLVESIAQGSPDESAIINAALVSAHLVYKDGQLADILIDEASGGQRAPYAKGVAEMAKAFFTEDPAFAEKASQAVETFLTAANGFEISVKPQEALPIAAVMAAGQDALTAEKLGLTVSGN